MMKFRKITSLLLAGMFFFSTVMVSAQEIDNTVQGKLVAIENGMYGHTQTGALLERTNKLEKDYLGMHPTGTMISRIDNLYNILYDNTSAPSAITQLNAIEWAVTHEVTMNSIQARSEQLETVIEGGPKEGTLKKRIAKLGELAFGGVKIPLVQTSIPTDTLVKIALVTPIKSQELKVGDTIKYQVAEDVMINGTLVFAKGAPGIGTVNKVTQARNFGRDAKVEIGFDQTTAIDGSTVTTFLGEKAKQEMKSVAMAAGATVAGMVLLGPIGVVTGAFINGKNINIEAGTELYIQTKEDTTVFGIQAAAK
ncbi:hypothetical protein [Propionispira raffinosivorans]|uniref:hypothetical protein n=1 Tax=Propionispira raffinosivorans TaxID=86959 RepID=UPI000375FC7C|nr:hypothetical protein [Propionispira raffinosivorans]